jgi:hypothetical protein
MDVCLYSVFVSSCVCSSLPTGLSSVQRLLLSTKIKNFIIHSEWEQAAWPNPSGEKNKELVFPSGVQSWDFGEDVEEIFKI